MADEVKEKVGNGSKKKLFIIAAIAVVLVIAATVGTVMFMNGKSSHKAQSAPVEAAAFHSLDPFIVNIYDGQELRYLKVKVDMELANAEAKTELTARQAQIRDAILV